MKIKRESEPVLLTIAVAVIIVIIVAFVYIGGGIWVYSESIAPEAPRNYVLNPMQSEDRIPGDDRRFLGLPPPPACGHLYNHPGSHRAWADCMGVGYDSSLIDELLYDDRGSLPPYCAKASRDGWIHKWWAHCMPLRGE